MKFSHLKCGSDNLPWSHQGPAADICDGVISESFQSVWPVLGILAYLLITCVLRVLRAQREAEIQVYDRVRASKKMRKDYLERMRDPEIKVEVISEG